MNRPEILAPAGSFESLTAAVFCGADAVYLGSKHLNARRNAGNFDVQELSRAVEFCHLRGVKVYQTLNILLFESEVDELLQAAETAAQLGVDGAMVQDFGVLSLLRRSVPDLPLFASTQMAVHNLAGALEAERLGCRRIVLARELSAAEIAHIIDNTSVEVEVFVHGALCMSVSGQCYLSSMLGGRSGNRGLCAQPCRLPFSVGKSSHALSLKDLTLVDRVAELAAMGVTSLKIEGRMKRPEYVAAAVTALRRALDGGQPDLDTLRSVFSRSGFTSGYFDGRPDGTMFGVRQKEDVVAASGVLAELGRLAVREFPHVSVEGAFSACAGEAISLSLRDANGNTVFAAGDPPQAAHTHPTDTERVRQSLQKTGGTPYCFSSLDIDLEDNLAMPASQLNALRRDAFERLTALRTAPRPLAFIPQHTEGRRRAQHGTTPPALRARCSAAQLSSTLIERCEALILPIDDIPTALSAGVPIQKVIAEIPRILFTGEETVVRQLSALRTKGILRAWTGNLGAVRLAREAKMDPCGGWSLNLTNSYAINILFDAGLCDTELSFELFLPQAKELAAERHCGIVAYGSLPLMSFRNCPIKAAVGCAQCGGRQFLTDRMGVQFRVRCTGGVSELLNSVPLYLADRRGELNGFSFLTLWFTEENADDCGRITAAYAGDQFPAPPDGYTRGLYYRTVL